MALSDPRYFIFLFVVAALLPLVPQGKLRLGAIASVSVCFYMAFSPIYAVILAFVTLLAYTGAVKVDSIQPGRKRLIIFIAILFGIFSPLLFFKYVPALLETLPLQASGYKLNAIPRLVLPVGISFYTFLAAGYLIDVYVGIIRSEQGLIRFAAFMSFFPQLTAGPIARSTHLLPQLEALGNYDYARIVSGFRLLLIGMFMKVVIADSLAPLVDIVYTSPTKYARGDLFIATFYFSFQVYADFAGYSLLAIGSARLLGIELLANFKQPYLSQTLPEYWRTWHISLSSWFRDYVFTPLHLQWRNLGKFGLVSALIITFIIVGVWHGAGLKYAIFGLIHGVLVAGSTLTIKRRDKILKVLHVPKWLIVTSRTFITFAIVTLSFVLFRANDNWDANYIYRIFLFGDGADHTLPYVWPLFLIGILIVGDLLAKRGWSWDRLPQASRWIAYQIISLVILVFVVYRWTEHSVHMQHFIYFKF